MTPTISRPRPIVPYTFNENHLAQFKHHFSRVNTNEDLLSFNVEIVEISNFVALVTLIHDNSAFLLIEISFRGSRFAMKYFSQRRIHPLEVSCSYEAKYFQIHKLQSIEKEEIIVYDNI